MTKIDITKAPCYKDSTNFSWNLGNVRLDNGDIIESAIPTNSICYDCDFFRHCTKGKTEDILILSGFVTAGIKVMNDIIYSIGEDFLKDPDINFSEDKITDILKGLIASMYEDIKVIVVSNTHNFNEKAFIFTVRQSLELYRPRIVEALQDSFSKS